MATCSLPECDNPRRTINPRSYSGTLCPSHRAMRWRQQNPDKAAITIKKSYEARTRRWRAAVDAIKLERGCIDCGYRAHPEALDFDHVRGEKKFAISASRKHAWRTVLKEIAKCEVRCKNCHATVTASRRPASQHRLEAA